MKIIGYFDCQNLSEAREKEQELFVQLGATLNSVEPLPMRREKMVAKPQQETNKYNCELCNYGCDNKTNFNKHLSTKYHNKKCIEFQQDEKQYVCKCGKIYKHRQGLHFHKKDCNYVVVPINDKQNITDRLIESMQNNANLIIQNHIIQNQIIEIYKDKSFFK